MQESSFPLYTTLRNDIKEGDMLLSNMEECKESLLNKVKSMDKQGTELIYALIRYHQIYIQQTSSPELLPFHGKKTKTGSLRFNLDLFPNDLLLLLNHFCDLHSQKIQEDSSLSNLKNTL